MNYYLALFDLDGTLIDSAGSICGALNELLETSGRKPALNEFLKKLIGYPLESVFERLGIPATDEMKAIYRDAHFRRIPELQKPYPGVSEILPKLARGMNLAIATNKGPDGARRSLEGPGLLKHFSCVMTRVEAGIPKPDPAMFRAITAHYRSQGIRYDAADALMIGDSPVDQDFAAACGIPFAFASWGFYDRSDLSRDPDITLEQPADLAAVCGIDDAVAVETTDELDLHTFPPGDVPALVRDYIAEAVRLGYRSVRIAHGKGRGILKKTVRQILSESPLVESFTDAPAHLGHFGATIVMIRSGLK